MTEAQVMFWCALVVVAFVMGYYLAEIEHK